MASKDIQNLIINFSSPVGPPCRVTLISGLIVELANSTVWPELKFCDCWISRALEQVIPVKSKNNINSCYWLVVSTQIPHPIYQQCNISHLQQAADKQCTHKPTAASWQVFILTSGVSAQVVWSVFLIVTPTTNNGAILRSREWPWGLPLLSYYHIKMQFTTQNMAQTKQLSCLVPTRVLVSNSRCWPVRFKMSCSCSFATFITIILGVGAAMLITWDYTRLSWMIWYYWWLIQCHVTPAVHLMWMWNQMKFTGKLLLK